MKKMVFGVTDDSRWNQVTVEITYSLGGMNYFTGKNEKRGYYFSITPEKVERGFRSYTSFTGTKTCLVEVKRKSKKAEAEADSMFDEAFNRYVNLWCDKYNVTLGEVIRKED